MGHTYPPDESNPSGSLNSRGSTNQHQDQDSDFNTLTKLTRTLMSLAGYQMPSGIPVDFSDPPLVSSSVPSTSPVQPEDEQDLSPSPSPTKTIRSRSRPPSAIHWLPPPSRSSRPSPSVPSSSPTTRSITLKMLPAANEELEEWNEPKTCRSWRGKMKKVEKNVLEVIHEEEEEFEVVSQPSKRVVPERKKRSGRQPRKKLSRFIRVYKDRGQLSSFEEELQAVANLEGKRRAGGILSQVEGNEQRKRRKRNQLPRQLSPASSTLLPASLFDLPCALPPSSPEAPDKRKSFRELEEEAQALEHYHRQGNDLIWSEEDPEHSIFDDDEDEDDDDDAEEAGDAYLYEEEEEDELEETLEWSLCQKES